MSWLKVMLLLAFPICSSAFAQVSPITINGNAPQNGQTYTLPVILSASATAASPNTITGWAVYFGNTEYYSSTTGLNGHLNVTINNAPIGADQKVTISAFDNTGADSSYVATNVTVVASAMPTIPANATAYTNVQVQANPVTVTNPGWLNCDTHACSGSAATSTCTNNEVLFGTAGTPSLSGASMSQRIDGTYCNLLNYRHLSCPQSGCKAVTNLLEDMWFQTTSTSQMQASEFDPDMYDGAAEYQLSTQCRLVSSPTDTENYWYLWDMAANTWEITPYTCNANTIAPGIWHHYQLYGNVDTAANEQTQTYQTFVFDGKVVFQNLNKSYSAAPNTGTAFVNVQAQIDNGGETDPTNTNYYDDYNVWAW